MRPSTRLRIALRAALRRRYGYAALRQLRRGVARAVFEHRKREVGLSPYASQADEIASLYRRALKKLARRWPSLRFDDPRAQP